MSSGRRILVVDDDPYTRDLASTALRGHGYEVVGAARFQQGLDAARAQRPHLVLCDVVLPDGSGIDVARSLRAELPEREMPIVILMSAFSKGRLADQRRMKEEAKAVAFLTKPLSLPAVVDLIRQHLPIAAQPAPAPVDPETARLMAPVEAPPPAPERPAAEAPAPARSAPPPEDPGVAAVALEPEAVAAATTPSPGRLAPAGRPAPAARPTPPAHPRQDAPPGANLLLGLANVWRKGWTGTLTVTREQVEKRIAFDRGQIVWCTTTLTEERLGRVLLRLGFLPRDQYEPCLKEAVDTNRRIGEVLVERGYLAQFQLDDALVQQMEGIVLGALAWPEGSYRVTATPGAPPEQGRLVISPVPRLVLRAFREVVSGDRLDERLCAFGEAPVARRPDVPGAALAQLSPSIEETRFLDALVAPAPVSVQLGRHPHGPDAAAPYLGALLALGIADSAARRSAPAAAKAAARPPEPKTPAEPKRASAQLPPPSSTARAAAEAAARRLLEAEAAFETGRSAVERKDLAAAADAITLATTLCPEEGEYRAWAAWIKALAARQAFDRTLDDVLKDLEQAVVLTPTAETIQELIQGVSRLRALARDAEA